MATVDPGAVAVTARRQWIQRPGVMWIIAVAAGLAAVMILRRPGTMLDPQFIADDGHFYSDALAGAPIWQPYAGYLAVIQRIVMAVSTLAPPNAAPLIGNVAALLITVAIAVLIVVRLNEPLLALALLILPGTTGVIGLMINIQWVLGVYLLVVLVEPRKYDAIFVLLVALEGPIAMLLAPLFAVRWWRRRDNTLILMALIAGSAAQLIVLAVTHSRHVAPDHAGALEAVLWRGLVIPLAGTHLGTQLPPILGVVIGALLIVTAWRLGWTGIVLVYVWCIFIFSGMFLTKYDPTTFVQHLVLTERYLFLPGAAIAALAILGAKRRIPAAIVLLPILIVGMVLDFQLPAITGSWATDSSCIGGPVACHVPVHGDWRWDVIWIPPDQRSPQAS